MKMRILLSAVLCVLLAVLTCVPALADVIWEPHDDFYHKEFVNCDYVGRSYTANGQGGTVAVMKEPGSSKTVATVNNGSTFYVSFSYTDKSGAVWGVVEFSVDASGSVSPAYGGGTTGWVRMSDLELVYDYISFDEEHRSEFKPYTGGYDVFKDINELVFWSYPGSGVIVSTETKPQIDEYFELTTTYTDGNGKLWGFVSYYYGLKNVWVCISDLAGTVAPTPDSLPSPSPTPTGGGQASLSPAAQASPTPDATTPSSPGSSPADSQASQPTGIQTTPSAASQQPATPGAQTPSPSIQPPEVLKDRTPMLLLIVGLVVAVVAVTAVLIAVLWKKKNHAVK